MDHSDCSVIFIFFGPQGLNCISICIWGWSVESFLESFTIYWPDARSPQTTQYSTDRAMAPRAPLSAAALDEATRLIAAVVEPSIFIGIHKSTANNPRQKMKWAKNWKLGWLGRWVAAMVPFFSVHHLKNKKKRETCINDTLSDECVTKKKTTNKKKQRVQRTGSRREVEGGGRVAVIGHSQAAKKFLFSVIHQKKRKKTFHRGIGQPWPRALTTVGIIIEQGRFLTENEWGANHTETSEKMKDRTTMKSIRKKREKERKRTRKFLKTKPERELTSWFHNKKAHNRVISRKSFFCSFSGHRDTCCSRTCGTAGPVAKAVTNFQSLHLMSRSKEWKSKQNALTCWCAEISKERGVHTHKIKREKKKRVSWEVREKSDRADGDLVSDWCVNLDAAGRTLYPPSPHFAYGEAKKEEEEERELHNTIPMKEKRKREKKTPGSPTSALESTLTWAPCLSLPLPASWNHRRKLRTVCTTVTCGVPASDHAEQAAAAAAV